MKGLIYFGFVFVIITSISCTKENWWIPNTTVHGKVTDYCKGSPIEYFTIELMGGDRQSSHHQKTIRTVTTGADGYYEIKFYRGSGEYWLRFNYDYTVVIPNPYTNSYRDLEIPTKGDHEMNLPLVASNWHTYLQMNIKNTSPFNNNDSIHFNITEPNNPFDYTVSPFNTSSFIGSSVDTFCYANVSGCNPLLVKLNWAVTKNGITNNYADSVVCTSGVTSYYAINY